MPESLLEKVDLYAEWNWEDRATAIRQLVAEGLRLKLQHAVIERIEKGQITIRQGADLLGVTYLEMDELLRDRDVPLVKDLSLAVRRASARPGRRRR